MGDEALLRELRIAALSDSPAAFGSTLQREQARTTDDWRRWFEPGLTLFWLDESEGAAGLVAATVDVAAGSADLVSMWVRTDERGRGAGDALVAGVVEWAQAAGLVLGLRVVENNFRAAALYERHGFRPTGQVHDRLDGVREVRMRYHAPAS